MTPLRGVGVDPLRNPVQLGALASAFVLARCMLISPLVYLVSSLAPCLVRRNRERAELLTRLCASVQGLHWRIVVPVEGGDGTVV